MTFGCLLRVTGKSMTERGLTIRRACRVLRMVLHKLANESGVELPADVYRSIGHLAGLEENTTPEMFAELLKSEGSKAVAEAEVAIAKANEEANEQHKDSQ